MKTQFTGRQVLIVFLLIVSTAIIASSKRTADPTPPAASAKPLFVSTFNQRELIGLLGHNLGTVVRVTGECIDGKTLRLKFYASKRVLRIETVNGEKLESPVDFLFPHDEDRVPPKTGERFDYYVHEYGTIDGFVATPTERFPKDFPERIAGIALPGFGYRSSLVIHKIMPLK